MPDRRPQRFREQTVIKPIYVLLVFMMGLTGFAGTTLTSMLMLSIMLVLAVGIADAIHILSAYLFFRNHGEAHFAALKSAYRKAALPWRGDLRLDRGSGHP